MSKPKDRSLEGRLAFSVEESARLLGVGPSTFDRWIRDGRVATCLIGRKRLVPKRSLEALLTPTAPDPEQPAV
jgi:excisionase family DNA binding protein